MDSNHNDITGFAIPNNLMDIKEIRLRMNQVFHLRFFHFQGPQNKLHWFEGGIDGFQTKHIQRFGSLLAPWAHLSS